MRVARLDEPTLDARIAALGARIAEARQRVALAQATARPEIAGALLELQRTEAELAREMDRRDQLDIFAAMDGVLRPVTPAGDLTGRWVSEGDVLGHVLPPRAEVVRLAVTQDDIALVRDRLTGVQLRLAGRMEAAYPGQLIRAVPQATFLLPAAALGTTGGGRALTDPADAEGLRALEQVFVFDVALLPDLADAAFGTRVHVRFDHGFEPAGAQIWRRVRQVFLRQFNA
jgi:putative peptide zinc metalloprotease protein